MYVGLTFEKALLPYSLSLLALEVCDVMLEVATVSFISTAFEWSDFEVSFLGAMCLILENFEVDRFELWGEENKGRDCPTGYAEISSQQNFKSIK